MKNEVINLVTKVVNGPEVTEAMTEVFATKKAVNYREFYAAQQVGLNPRLNFVVNLLDYNSAVIDGREPTELIYEGRRYVIIRVYEIYKTAELTVSNAT